MHKLDFLIIGAQKSGTQSLLRYLESHAQYFYLPNKELHFWNKKDAYRGGEGLSSYFENFKSAAPHQLIGEKSPSYLPSVEAPARIVQHFPAIKLIAILRDPRERAYSGYWHGRRVGAIASNVSFGESIRNYEKNKGIAYGDVVSHGFYAEQLERYLDVFPMAQMHVMDFKSTINNPVHELGEMIKFLKGCDPKSLSDISLEFPKRNVARESRFPKLSERIHHSTLLSYNLKSRILRKNLVDMVLPPMEESDQEFLTEIYSHEKAKLEKLFSRKFTW